MTDFVRKLLATIPDFYLTDMDLYEALGRGWRDMETILKKKICKLRTLKEGVLAAVKTELGMQTALLGGFRYKRRSRHLDNCFKSISKACYPAN